VFAIAVLTTRIFVWVAIDHFQKSSDGAKQAKQNSGKSWPGAVFDTSNDMTGIRVTAHKTKLISAFLGGLAAWRFKFDLVFLCVLCALCGWLFDFQPVA
jgi:hypothetical protein